MKKITVSVLILLLTVMIAVFSACNNIIDDSDLKIDPVGIGDSDVSVIYPASYEDWQKEDVDVLCRIFTERTGKNATAKPDTEAKTGKEIILADADREYGISALPNEADLLSAVIAPTKEGDIVLGGNGYYADLRGIYAFIHDFLGYDDIEEKVIGDVTAVLEKQEYYRFDDPALTVMAYDRGRYPFRYISDVKEMAEAGFNMVRLDLADLSEEQFCDYAKWCARFGIRMILNGLYNLRSDELVTPDFCLNNPLIYGHYLMMLPEAPYETYFEHLPKLDYENRYGKMGWKLVLEIPGFDDRDETQKDFMDRIENGANKDTLKGVYAVSCNIDLPVCGYDDEMYEAAKYDYVRKIGEKIGAKEFWATAIGSNIPLDFNYTDYPAHIYWNTMLPLAMGAKGIAYATYRRGIVVNDDYTRGDIYEEVRKANSDAVFMMENVASDKYEYVGCYDMRSFESSFFDGCFTETEPDFKDQYQITLADNGISLMIGCYKEKDGDGFSLIVSSFSGVKKDAFEDQKVTPDQIGIERKHTVYSLGEIIEDPAEITVYLGHALGIVVE